MSKGKRIIMPKYDIGILSDYNYSLHNTYEERIKSIKKSLKHHPVLKILQHINALRTLHKSNEKLYNKLNRDFNWIHNYYINK